MNKQLLSLLLLCTILPIIAGKRKEKKKPDVTTGFVIEEPNFQEQSASQEDNDPIRFALKDIDDELLYFIEYGVEDSGKRIKAIGPWFPSMSDSDNEKKEHKKRYPSYPPISISTTSSKFFPSAALFQLYYSSCGFPLIAGLYKADEIISEQNITFVNDHHTVVSRLKDGRVLVCNHHLHDVRPMYEIPIARTEGDHEETVKVDGHYIIVTNKDGNRFKLDHPKLEALLFNEDAEYAKDRASEKSSALKKENDWHVLEWRW